MSLSVQSRAASSSAIQASDGVAVSMAIASRVRGSARTWTFVATGPTTRLRRSMPRVWQVRQVASRQRRGSRLELGPHAVEGLADHLVGGALDEPRADAGERAGRCSTSALQSMTVAPSGPSDRPSRRVGVDGAARRLAVGLDDAPCPAASSSANVMSTMNRALMKPMPTLAVALKWVSSTTSIFSTPGPHWPTCSGSMTNAQTLSRLTP